MYGGPRVAKHSRDVAGRKMFQRVDSFASVGRGASVAGSGTRTREAGIGIPKKDQASLFESFSRASNVGDIDGTGLGLVIVKQFIEMHGGTISFQSEVHKGTTFTIAIPNV